LYAGVVMWLSVALVGLACLVGVSAVSGDSGTVPVAAGTAGSYIKELTTDLAGVHVVLQQQAEHYNAGQATFWVALDTSEGRMMADALTHAYWMRKGVLLVYAADGRILSVTLGVDF
jgi:hypothetical protein